jgi:hypothetical protein
VVTSHGAGGADEAAWYRPFSFRNFFPAAFLKESGEDIKKFQPASNGGKKGRLKILVHF